MPVAGIFAVVLRVRLQPLDRWSLKGGKIVCAQGAIFQDDKTSDNDYFQHKEQKTRIIFLSLPH